MNNSILDKSAEQHLQSLRRAEKMKLIQFRTLKSGLGYWETDFHIDGKRIRQKIPVLKKSQKSEAREFALQIYMRMMRGEILEQCTTTFNEMTKVYLKHKTIRDSGKNYRLPIIQKFIGDMCLSKISFRDYKAITNYLLDERGMKRQSVNRYLADIGAILNLAKKQRIIKDFYPITKLDADPRRKTGALTKEQLDTIQIALPDYLKDPFEFAYRTGLRKGNLVGLKKRHLSKRPDGTYKINFEAVEMKTNRAFEHICTKEETEILNRNRSIAHEYIFRRDAKVNGAKTNNLGDFKKAIITVREKTGIHFTWHWLRHTTATNYAKLGLNEQQMNTLMAWSPRSRMAGNYSHLRDEDFLAELRERTQDLRHAYDTQKEIEHNS